MATILAHIRVRPGAEARFEEVARALHDATHRSEDGVLRYEYWRGTDERAYYALLSFTDHAAFVAHQRSDHHEAASPELGELIESIRLEWVDPVGGASELPPTTPGAPGRWAAQVAGWWAGARRAGGDA